MAAELTHQALQPHEIVTGLRVRAQLRLLRLTAMVQSFKWEHGRLPNQLSEAVPADLGQDPLSREAFHYQIQAPGYKLFSAGIPATGEIQLTYRRPS